MSDGKNVSSLVVPDGSPSYGELRELCERLMRENARLERKLEEAENRSSMFWDVVETVACGEKMECAVCGKLKPCMCDKS